MTDTSGRIGLLICKADLISFDPMSKAIHVPYFRPCRVVRFARDGNMHCSSDKLRTLLLTAVKYFVFIMLVRWHLYFTVLYFIFHFLFFSHLHFTINNFFFLTDEIAGGIDLKFY